MTCSTVKAAIATTAMVTSAILLTAEPTPGAWLEAFAATRRPGAGPPERVSA
jgi:hypothetical protein